MWLKPSLFWHSRSIFCHFSIFWPRNEACQSLQVVHLRDELQIEFAYAEFKSDHLLCDLHFFLSAVKEPPVQAFLHCSSEPKPGCLKGFFQLLSQENKKQRGAIRCHVYFDPCVKNNVLEMIPYSGKYPTNNAREKPFFCPNRGEIHTIIHTNTHRHIGYWAPLTHNTNN